MKFCFAPALMLTLLACATAQAGILVPTHAIRARSVLSAADLVWAEGDIAGAYADIDALIGQEAKVTLYPGQPILAGDVGPAASVERNAIVTLTFRRGALLIRTAGRALDRGGAGDVIRVMNLASKTTISGRISTDGSIEVGG